MPYERSVAEVLSLHGDSLKDDIRKCLPAIVTAFDSAKQTVDVKVAIKNPIFDEYGTASFEEAIALAGVPYSFPQTSIGFLWIPPAVGDSVLLLFSDLSMDTFVASDGSQPVPPGWLGKHTADSAVAIPLRVKPLQSGTPSLPNDAVLIGIQGGDSFSTYGQDDIKVGRNATDFVALSAKIDSFVNILLASSYSATAVDPGFVALLTALAAWKIAYWGPGAATVAANLVKAQ